jgi:hypothetical protein
MATVPFGFVAGCIDLSLCGALQNNFVSEGCGSLQNNPMRKVLGKTRGREQAVPRLAADSASGAKMAAEKNQLQTPSPDTSTNINTNKLQPQKITVHIAGGYGGHMSGDCIGTMLPS